MPDEINIIMRYNYSTITLTCKDSNMGFIHKILAPKLEEILIKMLQFVCGKADKLNWEGAECRSRGRALSVSDGKLASIARYVERA